MSKAFKVIGAIFVILLLVAGGLVAWLMTAFDPNSYKPQIEQAAREQGVELDIAGDLGLDVFPSLAIVVGETRFESEQHGIRPSRIGQADLALSLMALLRKEVAIKALTLDGVDLNLTQLEQAGAVAAVPASNGQTFTSGDTSLAIAIDQFTLNNSTLTVIQGQTRHQFSNINITTSGVNLTGQPFSVSGELDYSGDLSGNTLSLKLDSNASFNQSTGLVELLDNKLHLQGLTPEPLRIQLAGQANLNDQSARLQTLDIALGKINLTGQMAISDYLGEQRITGTLSLKADDARSSLEALAGTPLQTASAKAFSQLALTSDVAGSASNLQLNNLKLQLDDTHVAGNMTFATGSPRSLTLNLEGDHINVDNYLPPADDTAGSGTATETTAAAALFAPVAAPLALLDGGNGNISFGMQRIDYQGVRLDNTRLVLAATGQRIAITSFTTDTFDGQVKASGNLNLSESTPTLSLNKSISGVDLKQVTAQLAEDANIEGLLTLQFSGTTSGNNQDALMTNLTGTGTLTIADPVITTINLEQQYCELAAMVEQVPVRENWPAGSMLNTLESQFHFDNGNLVLDNYTSGLGNLGVRGNGSIDLIEQAFNIRVITRLEGDRTSAEGCVVKSKRIRDRDIPLLCKDTFANAGAGSCKPDPDFVRNLLQSEVLDKLNLEGESGEAVEGLLRGLLNR